MISIRENIVRLDTPNTTLLIDTDGEIPQYLYYGKRLPPLKDGCAFLRPEKERTGALLDRQILSQFGRGDYRESSLLLRDADGSVASRFVFRKAETAEKPAAANLPGARDAAATVKIQLCDQPSGIVCNVFYSAFEDTDAVAVSTELLNEGERPVLVGKLASLQLDLNGNDYTVSTFDGSWAAERIRHDRTVGNGLFVNQSKTGSSSALHSPMFLVSDTEGVFGFNLVWSGNHKETAESNSFGVTRIIVGESDFLYEVRLGPGERLLSPEAVMCRASGEEELTKAMHAFVNAHILPKRFSGVPRPVLFNSWEGTGFCFDAGKLVSMARQAKALGAELFVVDDGWFGRRNDDASSLGDWSANPEKTGGGLEALSARIRETGLRFGIWTEPEMISEDSDLFRAHPEYAMAVPGRDPYRHRNQLMLDITLPPVKEYIVRSVGDIIEKSGADYVKWDYNRNMSDLPANGRNAVHYFRRYILSLYEILASLTKKYPDVLFEGCAAGGGRFDLGILSFMPQIWTSDNTDARERLDIQFSTALMFPQAAMGAHVSASPNGFTRNSTPLETRFNVACGGNLGYELDPETLSIKDRRTIRAQIAFYKKYRALFQFGTYYLLERKHASEICGYLSVSPKKNAAVGSVFVRNKETGKGNFRFSFKGLLPDAVYCVTERRQSNYASAHTFTATGALLMYGEIGLDGIFEDADAPENSNCIFSRMFVLKKIK